MIDCRTIHGCWRVVAELAVRQKSNVSKTIVNEPVISIKKEFSKTIINIPLKSFYVLVEDLGVIKFHDAKGYYTGFRLKQLK